MGEEMPDGRSLFEDRVYGALLAGAIGNAMGSSTECMLYPEIDEMYPEGVTTVLDPGRLEREDDNQMAMFLVETYLERGGKPVLARHFGRTWYDRLNRDHFYPVCMGAVYDMIRSGWDPRISGHWAVVTGSTVMCMEPVGIFHAADPEFAAIDATAISYMYQRGLDVVAATILAATVAETLSTSASVESVCEAALRAAPSDPWKTFDRRRFASCREYIEACLSVAEKYDDVMAVRGVLYHPIDPIELLGFSLAMFLVAEGDVRQAAIGGTNIGRDADTIAGRGAMFAGALNGSAGVPAEWMALFSSQSLERIRANAKRLTDLVLVDKQQTLRLRQAIAR
jgi:ADP-ribosylglycohydrolase